MPSSIVADCGHRERVGMIQDGECRDCRGVGSERIESTRTTNPHAEERSRHRVVSNVAATGGRR